MSEQLRTYEGVLHIPVKLRATDSMNAMEIAKREARNLSRGLPDRAHMRPSILNEPHVTVHITPVST